MLGEGPREGAVWAMQAVPNMLDLLAPLAGWRSVKRCGSRCRNGRRSSARCSRAASSRRQGWCSCGAKCSSSSSGSMRATERHSRCRRRRSRSGSCGGSRQQ